MAAARPLLAQIEAPVLAAILRRRLAELSGLPEAELRGLLGVSSAGAAAHRENAAPPLQSPRSSRPARTAGFGARVRRPPSLTRQLIQGLLLQPHLVRTLEFPQPKDPSPESATLRALVAFCAQGDAELTPAGILQAFVGTDQEGVLAEVLAAAEDHQLDASASEAQVRDGLTRWWQQARRAGAPVPATESDTPKRPSA